MARPKKQDETKLQDNADLGGFEEEAEEQEAAPIPIKKKVAQKPPVLARVPDEKEGYFPGANKHLAYRKDDTDPTNQKTIPERKGGYLNQHGVLFPDGYRFQGGHVAWTGEVCLNKCPKCGFRNPAEQAIKGSCSNNRANDGNGCNHSPLEALENIESV